MSSKADKVPCFLRLPAELQNSLFEESVEEQLVRRVRVSVPSLIVEKLEWLQAWKAADPAAYSAAKAAVENNK